MTLRARLALLVALVVGVTVAVVSMASWLFVRQQLLDDVDDTLHERAELAVNSPELRRLAAGEGAPTGRPARRPSFPPDGPRLADPFGDPDTYFQIIDADGQIVDQPGAAQLDLPVNDADIEVADGTTGATVRDVEVGGERIRMITAPAGAGHAVQVGESLTGLDETLGVLLLTLGLVGATALVVSVVIGVALVRKALTPVSRLTDAAESVATTQDLSERIAVGRDDEVGRLATSFNAMLEALNEAREQQRQLVADASHELRTPLTALRTNIEVLARATERGQLDEAWARDLMRDAQDELQALSTLVAEIVELATDSRRATVEHETVQLDELVRAAADRTARRTGRTVDVDASPCVVTGSRSLLDRAVGNLLDNAVKWSADGAAVEVRVSGGEVGEVTVADHGPGIRPGDERRIFDRFYRSPGSADVPGSGLGLAIVRQVIERHGGEVFARNAPGGGAQVGFRLPVATPEPVHR